MLKTPAYLILAYILSAALLIVGCQWLLSRETPATHELVFNAEWFHYLTLEELTAEIDKIMPEEVPKVAVVSPSPPTLQRQSVIMDGQNINLLLPLNWSSAASENQIVLADKTGQARGEITLVGYYENYVASLPNHSAFISEEDTTSPFGNGKLFVLERSYPAVANKLEKWEEIYAVIPIFNKDLAYLFWIKADPQESIEVNKDLLRFIINHIEISL